MIRKPDQNFNMQNIDVGVFLAKKIIYFEKKLSTYSGLLVLI